MNKQKYFHVCALAVTLFCAMFAVAAVQAQPTGFTVVLDWNFLHAPEPETRRTDAHGNIMGEPLPVPRRAEHVFTGWFTTAATGGARVLVGATGTKFAADDTIFARWREATPVSINEIPPVFKENFDWIRYVRHNGQDGGKQENNLFRINSNGTVGAPQRLNLIWDQIFHGQGTINWAVRWHSDRVVTLAERQAIALLLHEEINKWTRPLIGMEGWPFQEIPVTVIGWAVSSASFIRDRQPNETIWVNNDHREPRGIDPGTAELMASAPDNISRFVNFNNVNNGRYTYPGGLHARFDMVLWPTKGMGGGAGGDWGSRLGDTYTITAANNPYHRSRTFILTHEIGHGFGLYDFYGAVGEDRPPQTSIPDATGNREFNRGDLRTVMSTSTSPRVAAGPDLVPYDQWQIRYYWDWIRTDSPSNRFPTITLPPVLSETPPPPPPPEDPCEIDPDLPECSDDPTDPCEDDPTLAECNIDPTDPCDEDPELPECENGTNIATRYAARNGARFFAFDNRGNLRYNLGSANSATLKIFDARGRVLQTVQLGGGENYARVNLRSASQMLLWQVEIGGRVADRGRVRTLSRR